MGQTKGLMLLAGAALGMSATGAALAQATPDEVRAIVAEMMADADTRSSLLQGAGAGHDGNHFFLAGDGFQLKVAGQIQFRYLLNFRDDDNAVGDDDFDPGFEFRRNKIEFSGRVHEDWGFKVIGAFDRNEGSFVLEDSWISYRINEMANLRMGQFKAPLLREELVSSKYQLAADRSVTNSYFTAGRVQGVIFDFGGNDEDAWRAWASFNDGQRTANTGFTSAAEGDYGLTGRFEYKFDGTWDQFDDFTAAPADGEGDFAALLGGGINYDVISMPSGSQTDGTGDVDTWRLTYTGDVSLEGAGGWNLYGAFIGMHTEMRAGGSDTDFDDFGVIVQGGYRWNDTSEIFGRWDAIFGDEDHVGDEDNFHFLTFGYNHYFAGHAAKATVDAVISLNETEDLVSWGALPQTGLGVLGDSESGEVVFRFQFQLLW